MDILWRIALEATDFSVAKLAIEFLNNLYKQVRFCFSRPFPCFSLVFHHLPLLRTPQKCACFLLTLCLFQLQLAPELKPHVAGYREDYIKTCMTKLASAAQQAQQLQQKSGTEAVPPPTLLCIERSLYMLKVRV